MYLGIDLGTSGVKALLIDDGQRVVGTASSRPLEVSRPRRGWSEQDPDLWWDAVCEAVDQLGVDHARPLSAVRGIGLSGQMYGATVLDEHDRPLRPGILWNDTRSGAECVDMEVREPNLRRIAGRRATPGVTAPKLAWLARHEPQTFRRIRTVLLPKDYVRLQLTGEMVADMADASGSLWLDLARRDWSDSLLDVTGLDRRQMPRLVEGTAVSGRLRPEIAARWHMAAAPVVAGGGGDNACGACGSGAIHAGDGTISLGTSGVLWVVTDAPKISHETDIESLCHSLPRLWAQMSVILSATSCLNWLAGVLKRPAADLVASLGQTRRPATGLQFLPFLDGCWSPKNDAQVRGALVGIEHRSDDAALTHAVLQGVAFAMMEAATGFRENGAAFGRLLALGGGSRSSVWMSMLADTLGVEIAVPAGSELGAAFGAARLGLIAATGADPATVLTRPEIARVIAPDPELAPGYRDAFERWHALYAPVRAACIPA
jgi:xylulokinase